MIESKTAIGIDFGGTSVKIGLVAEGKLVARAAPIPTRGSAGPEELLRAIHQTIARLREGQPAVSAIGAGLPGMVDCRQGIVKELSNVPGWIDMPLAQLLTAETGLPAFIDNDANAMTYAEWRFGAGRDAMNVVCMTLGTGVGGGLILDGKMYRGSQLGAGEIGQMTIDPRGVPGHYGNFGALEKYVGNSQIAERARVAYNERGAGKTEEELTPLGLSLAARAGDPVAQELWEAVGFDIGVILCDIIWLLNPDRIVIGGGVGNAGDLVFVPINRTIRERTMAVYHEHLQVVPAELGNDAGMIGSAALGLRLLSG